MAKMLTQFIELFVFGLLRKLAIALFVERLVLIFLVFVGLPIILDVVIDSAHYRYIRI